MKIFKNLIILGSVSLSACFLSINAQLVEIRLLPDLLSFEDSVVNVPLFIIMLIFMGAGLLLGTILEYFRSYRDLKVAKKNIIQDERRNTESKSLRSSVTSETDEILSLLK